jgi:transcription elongation factor Elf1
LGEDPLVTLGMPTWTTLTNVAEVYQKEKAECASNLGTVDWKFDELSNAFREWECPKCGSGLIDVENTGTDKWSAKLKCRACGESFDFETAAESAVKSFYWADNHISVQDGGEGVTLECPLCLRDTYLLDENVCLVCEETAERQCQVCENSIPASEIDGTGICGYCRHMMEKED